MPIAQINGQGIYYEDSGGDGPAVVMMHGFLFDTTMFDGQVAALAPRYRCVRFDARALGQTQWDGKPFTLYDTVADCIGLMDHLGIEKAAIVGMSQGGYAAVRLAVKHPERVTALVFMSTFNGVDIDDVKNIYRANRDTWKAEGPDSLLGTYSFLFLGPQEQFASYWETWQPKWKARTGEEIYHGMNNLIDRDDVTPDQVAKITMPALVIHGESDAGMPIELGEGLYKSLPNAKGMVRISGAAHAANVTHADKVNEALLAFLDEYVAVKA